jgi:hypothetical protein
LAEEGLMLMAETEAMDEVEDEERGEGEGG